MKYYYLEPEVAGGLGEKTLIDSASHPPVVYKLHYVFDGWLGDDIVESFPCYVISDYIRGRLDLIDLSGYNIADMVVSTSEVFEELQPEVKLPKFWWLQVTGVACEDDFGIAADHRLVVSGRALHVLKMGSLENCDIEPYLEPS